MSAVLDQASSQFVEAIRNSAVVIDVGGDIVYKD
jgi:hypothetical protein